MKVKLRNQPKFSYIVKHLEYGTWDLVGQTLCQEVEDDKEIAETDALAKDEDQGDKKW